MKNLDEILGLASDLVVVNPPRAKKEISLRWPSFEEWHQLAIAHRLLDGQDPPAELIARTVAVCVANEDGARKYQDNQLPELMKASPRLLMWLYTKCWATVLKNDEAEVKAEEGK